MELLFFLCQISYFLEEAIVLIQGYIKLSHVYAPLIWASSHKRLAWFNKSLPTN